MKQIMKHEFALARLNQTALVAIKLLYQGAAIGK